MGKEVSMGVTIDPTVFGATVQAYIRSIHNPDYEGNRVPTLTLYAVFVLDSIWRVYTDVEAALKFKEGHDNGRIEVIKIMADIGSLSPMVKIKTEIAFTTKTVIMDQIEIEYFPTLREAARRAAHLRTFNEYAFLDDGDINVYEAKFNPREWCWECTRLNRTQWTLIGEED